MDSVRRSVKEIKSMNLPQKVVNVLMDLRKLTVYAKYALKIFIWIEILMNVLNVKLMRFKWMESVFVKMDTEWICIEYVLSAINCRIHT